MELGVSCQLDKQGGEPDDRGLMILPLTVSVVIVIRAYPAFDESTSDLSQLDQ